MTQILIEKNKDGIDISKTSETMSAENQLDDRSYVATDIRLGFMGSNRIGPLDQSSKSTTFYFDNWEAVDVFDESVGYARDDSGDGLSYVSPTYNNFIFSATLSSGLSNGKYSLIMI